MALAAFRVASGHFRELLFGQLELRSRAVCHWRRSLPVRSARVVLILSVASRFVCSRDLSAEFVMRRSQVRLLFPAPVAMKKPRPLAGAFCLTD